MVGVVVLLLLVFGTGVFACQAWEDATGGPVRSAVEYQARVEATKSAGAKVVRQLEPAPYLRGTLPGTRPEDAAVEEHVSPSCKDDFGADGSGVTRHQPVYSWELRFRDREAYRSAVRELRRVWNAQGFSVRETPSPEKGEPGHGLPGIWTSDGNGIELSLAPDHYSGRPLVRADGGCIRHY